MEPKDYFTISIAFLALIVSAITFYKQSKSDKTSKTMSCLTDLFEEYTETMGNLNEALTQAKELEKYLEDCISKKDFSGFNNEYYDQKYVVFRKVHYFFELLGSLARQKEISRKTLNYFFSFPIEYFIETYNIRHIIKKYNCLPDYGGNFCWLFVYYNNCRLKDKRPWIANGKNGFFSFEDTKKYAAEHEHNEC